MSEQHYIYYTILNIALLEAPYCLSEDALMFYCF